MVEAWFQGLVLPGEIEKPGSRPGFFAAFRIAAFRIAAFRIAAFRIAAFRIAASRTAA